MRTVITSLLMLVAVVTNCPAPLSAEEIDVTHLPWSQEGVASWYGSTFHNKLMANGKRFNQLAMTCAHRFLPLGSKIWVRLSSGKQIRVVVTDRGPSKTSGRIIDLSKQAAKQLGILKHGLASVTITLCKQNTDEHDQKEVMR